MRRWLRLAKALADGERPALPGIDCAPAYGVRSAGILLETSEPWFERAQKWLRAESGVLQESI